MADIDIFSLEPSKISRDLKGKFLLIYGQPKTGKSTFGSQLPRALFMNFEQGTNALAGIKSQPILRWTDAKKVLTQLRKPQAKEIFDTIVVDTASIAWQLCEKYICQRENVDSIRDVPWGQGWNMLKQEFSEFWREITLLGFGILFIAHSKDKPTEMRTEDGEAITAVCPDLPNQCYTIINSIVDIIGYLQVQMNPDGTSERFLYTRSTPYIFAGSRYQYLAPKIKFGYQELVDAIGDAIDKAVERGCTIFTAKGGYQGDERQVLMCACSDKQMYQVNRVSKKIDVDAFIVIMESKAVYGEGFKRFKP